MINTFTTKTYQTQVLESVAVTSGQYAFEFHAEAYALSCDYDPRIGGLRANLSDECCRFVMVKDKRWDWIEALLQ
jgi:hypothetical protein